MSCWRRITPRNCVPRPTCGIVQVFTASSYAFILKTAECCRCISMRLRQSSRCSDLSRNALCYTPLSHVTDHLSHDFITTTDPYNPYTYIYLIYGSPIVLSWLNFQNILS